MTHARAPWLLLIVTVLLFAPLSMADFLWDDQILVTENLLTGDWHNLPEFFRIGLWESTPIAETDSAYYRPMMLVDLWLDRQLFGLSPLAHHLHSLAWHLLCTWLLWRLLLLLAPGNRRAAVFRIAHRRGIRKGWPLFGIWIYLPPPTRAPNFR